MIPESQISISTYEVGHVAYGIVRKATFNGLSIAVKTLHDVSWTKHMAEAFRQEAQFMSQIHSPFIVQFFGIYIFDNGSVGIVMELMAGSLYNILESTSFLPEKLIVTICTSVAAALTYLHESMYAIHSDISAKNVLCDSQKTIFKLADVGQARILAQKSGSFVVGCAAYAAPEVLINHKSTFSSDVFSYGVLCIQICCLEFPVSGQHQQQVAKISNTKFHNMLLRCIFEDPSKRPKISDVLNYWNNIT